MKGEEGGIKKGREGEKVEREREGRREKRREREREKE